LVDASNENIFGEATLKLHFIINKSSHALSLAPIKLKAAYLSVALATHNKLVIFSASF